MNVGRHLQVDLVFTQLIDHEPLRTVQCGMICIRADSPTRLRAHHTPSRDLQILDAVRESAAVFP
jgi:hypothetical protein